MTFDLSKCKPFNLDRALAGDPVVTRGGRTASRLAFNELAINGHEVVFWVDRMVRCCDTQGKTYKNCDAPDDLFMAPKKKTYWIGVFRYDGSPLLCSTNPKESRDEAYKAAAQTYNSRVIETYPIEIEE